MGKHKVTIIKLAITAVLLAIVLRGVNFQEMAALFGSANLFWLLGGFVLFLLGVVIRAFRWSVLLKGLGSRIRYGRLVELYFVAGFFNTIFPSSITGDVVRAYEAAQDVPAGIAAGTVIVDRAAGILALFMLALLALPFRPDTFPDLLLIQIVVICTVGLIGGFVILQGSLVRKFGRFVPKAARPLWDKLDKVLIAVEACGWRSIWQAIGISLIFNLMQTGWWWAAGKSLNYDISFVYYMLTTPIMSLAILLPSIGGLGIREGLAPLLFTGAGLSYSEAVALSLLVFAIERTSGLMGGPIYIWTILRQDRPEPDSLVNTAGQEKANP